MSFVSGVRGLASNTSGVGNGNVNIASFEKMFSAAAGPVRKALGTVGVVSRWVGRAKDIVDNALAALGNEDADMVTRSIASELAMPAKILTAISTTLGQPSGLPEGEQMWTMMTKRQARLSFMNAMTQLQSAKTAWDVESHDAVERGAIITSAAERGAQWSQLLVDLAQNTNENAVQTMTPKKAQMNAYCAKNYNGELACFLKYLLRPDPSSLDGADGDYSVAVGLVVKSMATTFLYGVGRRDSIDFDVTKVTLASLNAFFDALPGLMTHGSTISFDFRSQIVPKESYPIDGSSGLVEHIESIIGTPVITQQDGASLSWGHGTMVVLPRSHFVARSGAVTTHEINFTHQAMLSTKFINFVPPKSFPARWVVMSVPEPEDESMLQRSSRMLTPEVHDVIDVTYSLKGYRPYTLAAGNNPNQSGYADYTTDVNTRVNTAVGRTCFCQMYLPGSIGLAGTNGNGVGGYWWEKTNVNTQFHMSDRDYREYGSQEEIIEGGKTYIIVNDPLTPVPLSYMADDEKSPNGRVWTTLNTTVAAAMNRGITLSGSAWVPGSRRLMGEVPVGTIRTLLDGIAPDPEAWAKFALFASEALANGLTVPDNIYAYIEQRNFQIFRDASQMTDALLTLLLDSPGWLTTRN